jgi:hypothetical protein
MACLQRQTEERLTAAGINPDDPGMALIHRWNTAHFSAALQAGRA